MEFLTLNKFEKEKKVIELHKQGKTIREIAPIVHMSFRDISKKIKAYDKKISMQQSKKDDTQSTTKKLSQSSQAFILFRRGKKIEEVKVLLDMPFKKAVLYWQQYLKSIRMFEAFEFYKEYSYDVPMLLSINNFMKRNSMFGNDIVHVLRTTQDVINLNQMYSKIKNEIEKLKQMKNNLQYSHNNYLPPLKPLPKPINWNY